MRRSRSGSVPAPDPTGRRDSATLLMKKSKNMTRPWTEVEGVYCRALIEHFEDGMLPLQDGIRLGVLLSKALKCPLLRISLQIQQQNVCSIQQLQQEYRGNPRRLEKGWENIASEIHQKLVFLEQRFLASLAAIKPNEEQQQQEQQARGGLAQIKEVEEVEQVVQGDKRNSLECRELMQGLQHIDMGEVTNVITQWNNEGVSHSSHFKPPFDQSLHDTPTIKDVESKPYYPKSTVGSVLMKVRNKATALARNSGESDTDTGDDADDEEEEEEVATVTIDAEALALENKLKNEKRRSLIRIDDLSFISVSDTPHETGYFRVKRELESFERSLSKTAAEMTKNSKSPSKELEVKEETEDDVLPFDINVFLK